MTRRQLRAAWLSVHKWIGLALCILLAPIALAGSLLVWPDQIDALLNPPRHAAVSLPKLGPSVYLAAARAALGPDERIASLTVRPGVPVVVTALDSTGPHPRPGPPARTSVWLDPGDAHVIDKGATLGGVMRVVHVFHGSLLVPGTGRTVVGLLGVAMLLSTVSGLWIWWPVKRGWTRGLRWGRRRETSANLHHQIGFWISLPLAILSVTGILIAFPSLTDAPSMGQRMRGQPLATTARTLDQAVADARADPAALQVTWPTDAAAVWTIGSKGRTVSIDDRTGLATTRRSDRNPGFIRRVHEGEGLTIVWRVIVTLVGLAPAVLAVTGIIMWMRARRWRLRPAVGR